MTINMRVNYLEKSRRESLIIVSSSHESVVLQMHMLVTGFRPDARINTCMVSYHK